MIPGPGVSGSSTTAAPTPRAVIRRAASRSVCGPDRENHGAHPVTYLHTIIILQFACNDWLNATLPVTTVSDHCHRRQRASLGSCRVLGILSDTPFVEPAMPQQRSSTVRLRTSLFEEAVAIVERVRRDLALDDIARRVASSRRQLQRAYAEIGHTTFRAHLTGVRMDAPPTAARAALTVREVAQRVGYRQPAQFAKAFRRHHGVSPSSYRARRRLAMGTPATRPPHPPPPPPEGSHPPPPSSRHTANRHVTSIARRP